MAASTFRRFARGCLLLLLACLCLGVGVTSALASDMAQAQAAYSEGFDLYKKRKYRKAMPYFFRALKLAPRERKYRRFRSAMHFFAGMCTYRQRRWSLAQRHLKAFLRMGGGSKAYRAEAKGALGVVNARMAARRRARRRSVNPRPAVVVSPNVRYQPPRPVTPRPTPTPVRRAVPVRPPPSRQNNSTPDRFNPFAKTPRTTPLPQSRVTRAATRQPPRPPASGGPHPASYALLGIGVAALVTAGVLVGVAQAQQASAMDLFQQHQSTPAQDKPNAKDVIDPLNQARTMSYVAYGMAGGGAALGIVGVVLLVTLRRPAPPPPADNSTKVRIQMAIFP